MLYQTKNPHGGDLFGREETLDFSSNIHPLGTPESVKRAVIGCADRLDCYPDPYCRALVAAIAQKEGIPEDQILCGCGAAELIFSFCAAARPQTVLMPVPTFSEYANALQQNGCKVIEHFMLPDKDFPLEEDFLQSIRLHTPDAVFLCNPNNPTGRLIPQKVLLATVDLCERMGCRLFVDECFLELSDGWEGDSLKNLLTAHPTLFLLRAFTKSYGMAGLRLGYCLSGDKALLQKMGSAVQPWNVSLPAQAAGIAAMRETGFVSAGREIIQTERPWMEEHLRQIGFTVVPSQANFILFFGDAGLGEAILPYGVQIRDCSNYSGLGAGWYRVAVKRHAQNAKLIDALAHIKRGG